MSYSEELATAICARVVAGESVSAICMEAGMPSRATVRHWAEATPTFGTALRDAMRTARTRVRAGERQLAAELAAQPVSHQKRAKPGRYSRGLAQTICRRLADGETLTAIGRDPAMPHYGTILAWVRRHAEFEDMYVEARRIQADYLFDEARDVALAATPHTVWADRLRFDVIRWMTARLAPRKYCERLVVAQGAAEIANDAAGGLGMTVIVKRFSEVTAAEQAQADAVEARAERWR